MSKPNWACSVCGMWSGRKESVRRHIDNPNIHMGNGIEISFSDSLIARLTGTNLPNPVTSNNYNRRNSNFFPNRPEKMFALFEKELSQKMADKIANNMVNFDWTHQYQHTYYNYNNYNLPNVNNRIKSFTSIEDLYALEMQMCPKCLMFDFAKICYGKGENTKGLRSSITFPCCPPLGYIAESQAGQNIRAGIEASGCRLLKKWLDIVVPTLKDIRIVAIPVPHLSPSNSRCAVRVSVNDSKSDSTMKKHVTIEYLKEKCYDLFLSSDSESNHWSARVFKNESTTFGDDDHEVMDYLSCTKLSTYGFFRIRPQNPSDYSIRIPSGSIYLIMLLFDNNFSPTIDNVFDIV